jgi:phthiocerol/phenolphthiocerol synthesis type-I polyketide synthase E
MIPTEAAGAEPVAIIGMACRVPGAGDAARFWQNLVDGVESIRAGTVAECLAAGTAEQDARNPDFVPVSAALPDPEYFDAAMFGMSASEAQLRDPQHRLFLELSYTALDDSGYDPRRYGGEIGVYAGCGEDSYQWRYVRRNRGALARTGELGLAVNSHPDYVATLTSFKLGLRGPSLTVHTACSTSLVAIHLACEALRNGECDMALAGAADIELPLGRGYVYLDGGVVAKDGHCRAFDASATGTVWGSGGGVVLLKRLPDAVADGDNIRAVIIGNAVNNDGDGKVGFTAPSQQGQAAVIAQALSVADVDPRTIGFVEAHGTGTVIGDPIEVAALTSVYQQYTGDIGWCAIGSVKTNIGHLGPAAGVAGLIKAALAVGTGIIPPSLHFEVPNPALGFGENPFFVNTAPLVWDGRAPRRAAVSSFGMGGTNAHIILEQAPPPPARPERPGTSRGWELIQLSARTESALAAAAATLADHLDAAGPAPDDSLADIAYTLRAGRQQLPQRLAVVAASRAEAAAALRDERRRITGSVGRETHQPVFLFPGQGAQYPGMGADLYASEPAYRDTVDECCGALAMAGAMAQDAVAELREFLTAGGDEERLQQTALAQPALFIAEYALAAVWRAWGVTPRAMIGHSIGEYVAAACAGVLSLPDALRVVAARGALMQSLPAGAMIAVQLDEAELRDSLPETASIAAVNGPRACVVAGPASVIDELADAFGQADIGTRRLRTSHAFHSAMMAPALSAFRDVVATAALAAPQIPFASNITGDWITAAEATDPSYWARQLREAVRFGDCVTTVAGDTASLFVECGPGRQLSGLIRMRRAGHTALQCLPGPGETKSTGPQLLGAALGHLWANGCDLDPAAIGAAGNRVALPTYPWERQYHWVQPDPDLPDGTAIDAEQDGGRSRTPDQWFAVPAWRQVPPAGGGRPAGRVLVLGDDDGWVADGLSQRGSEVIRVRGGTGYERDGGGYRVRPARREDYDALLADLSAGGPIPAHIVHCWALAAKPAASAEGTWAAQDDGFFSVLSLVQALAARAPEEGIRLDVVTAGTAEAVGHDLDHPEHAPVAGAVKVLPVEFGWLTARQIDVDCGFAARAGGSVTGQAAALIDELCTDDRAVPPDEPLVALRNGRRWRRRFDSVPVPPEAGDEQPGAVLRPRGVYVITGGLGGIGITIAEDLARRFAARLVLVSRDGLPPRAQWDEPAAAATASPRASRAMAAIRRMEQGGAEVLVIAADVADPAAAREVRDQATGRFGPVSGLIHAAGVPGGGMAEIKDRQAAEEVLRPKIAGTLALRDAFAGDRLDFVVLCSSVTAVAGGFGQVDYCAANAFLDAHAASDHGWQARVVSVNWGAWLDVGMAAEVAAPVAFRALQRGERMLPVRHVLLSGRHPEEPDGSAWCSGTVSPATHWVLADHRIEGVPVLPGTACLEAARCAFEECRPAPGAGYLVELSDVLFTRPLAVPDGTSAEVRVVLAPAASGMDFEVLSVVDGERRVHARGSVAWVQPPGEQMADLAAIRERCSLGQVPADRLSLSGSGLVTFGEHWGNVVRVHRGAGEELALLAATPGAEEPWVIQPAMLDEAVTGWFDTKSRFLPFGYGRVLVRRPLPTRAWSHLRYTEPGSAGMTAADVTLYDEAGHELLRIEEFTMRAVETESVAGTLAAAPGAGEAADAIKPAAGAEAFRRLVNSRLAPQAVISALPVGDMIAAAARLDYQAVAETLPGAGPDQAGATHPDGLGTPKSDRERAVAEIFADLLGRSDIGSDEDFFDIGGDSLVAVQLISFLRKRFGIRLPMRRFFANPSVAGITALIEELSSDEAAEAVL